MHQKFEARLESLRAEFAAGQRRQQELQREQMALHESLLRISDAIQVLEELLAEPEHRLEANVRAVESI